MFNYALYLSLVTASNRIHLIIILTLPLIVLQDSMKLILSSAKIPEMQEIYLAENTSAAFILNFQQHIEIQ